jgi:hypothetical protein
VDPSKDKDSLPILREPSVPMAKDVNPEAATISALSDDEKEELKLLRFNYKHKLSVYERQDAALASLRTYIQETISRTFLPYTFKGDTVYDILVALKKRVAPTDKARKIELTQRYQKLKKAPHGQNVETWLQQWERTFTECKELNLPVVSDDLPIYDFLQAISDVSPEFSNVWTVNLQTKEADGEALPDLYRIVELFRNHQRLYNAQKGRNSTFPASYQGKSLEDSDKTPEKTLDEKKDSEKKKRPCVCGLDHRFEKCPYLIESIRPKDWKPDLEIQKKIDDKLKNPNCKAAVKRAQKKAVKEQQEKSTKST